MTEEISRRWESLERLNIVLKRKCLKRKVCDKKCVISRSCMAVKREYLCANGLKKLRVTHKNNNEEMRATNNSKKLENKVDLIMIAAK